MAAFDLTGLTINDDEARDLQKAVFEATITGGKLAEFHEIETGIEHKTQIAFVGNLELVGKKQTTCDRTENGSSIPLTEKFWDPVIIGDRLKHCASDINTLLKLFKKAKNINPDFYDRIGGEEFGVIIAKLEQAITRMHNRLVWFGDTAADTVANSGVITNGTDVGFFTPFDGLFKQIFTDVPTSASNYVAIAENATASKALQTTLAADRALTVFRAMYNAMDARFHEAVENGAQPQFLVTRQLAQNWEDFLEDKSFVFMLNRAEQGSDRLSYRGIPIKIRHDWDSVIRTYQDNGTTFNLPHRAVLTVKENIPVGTLDTASLNKIESWYEKKDKANYIDFDMSLDAKHLLSYLTVAAY